MIKNNKQNVSFRKLCLAGIALGVLGTNHSIAMAQDDMETEAAEVRKLPQVTVTARKQEETLQDVPVSVTSVGGDEIDQFQLDKIAEISTRTPGLKIVSGGSGSGGSLTLRGIGSSSISAAFDSAVLLDIDGVPVSSMRLVQSSFHDLRQVDVLKGPQSLFFGKSASAGVISLASNDPSDEFEASASAAYEFEERAKIFEGVLSGPISDTFGARLAVRYQDAEELVSNTAPGVANPERGEETLDARLTLAWEPTPDFRANLKLTRSELENDGPNQFADVICAPNGTFLSSNGFGLPVPSGVDCDPRDEEIQISDYAPDLGGNVSRGGSLSVPFVDTEISLARLNLEWDLSPSFKVNSTTGFFDLESESFDTFSFDVNNFGGGFFQDTVESFSQELRLESAFDGPFNFMAGAFYEDREVGHEAIQYPVNAARAFIPAGALVPPGTPGFPPTGFPFADVLPGPDPVTGFTDDFRRIHTTEAEAFSLFASFDFDLSEDLTLSGGLRYTDEEKTNDIVIPYVHSTLLLLGFLPGGTELGPIEFSDENVSPEASITYQYNDNVNLYAAYKTGFKSGGIDNSALPTGGLAVALASNDFSSLVFDSETSQGFEAGIKSTLADGTLRWNTVAFHYVYEDLQVQTFDAPTLTFTTSNAGELTTSGIETDILWLTPVDGLNISSALAYNNAEYTDTFVLVDDLNGRAPALAPEFTGNIGADYTTSITPALDLRLSGLLAMSGDYLLANESLNDLTQSSYATLDLGATIGSKDGGWEVSLIANNVSDEIYGVLSGDRPFSVPNANGAADRTLTTNRGRQVFLRGAVRF